MCDPAPMVIRALLARRRLAAGDRISALSTLLVGQGVAQCGDDRARVLERVVVGDALTLGDAADELVERHSLGLAAAALSAALQRRAQLVGQHLDHVVAVAAPWRS